MDVREKLVEIIQNSVGGCTRHWAEVIADGLIAQGVTVQEWISVDDRLPAPWKRVLIYSRHDFCESAVYIGIPGKWRVTWNHEMLDDDNFYCARGERKEGYD